MQQPSRELLDSLQSLHGRLHGGAVVCGELRRGGSSQQHSSQQSVVEKAWILTQRERLRRDRRMISVQSTFRRAQIGGLDCSRQSER